MTAFCSCGTEGCGSSALRRNRIRDPLQDLKAVTDRDDLKIIMKGSKIYDNMLH